MKVTCPKCGEDIHVSEDVSDYDFNTGCSFDGQKTYDCQNCSGKVLVEAHASIDWVEVVE